MMKRIFLCCALAISIGACNNNKAEKESELELDNAAAIDYEERARLQDSMTVISDATVVPSPTLIPEEPAPAKKPRANKPAPKKQDNDNSGTAGTGSPAPQPDPAPSPTPVVADDDGEKTAGTGDGAEGTEEKKKKGINNTAKGAIIGAGAGAVGGAIINKKNPGKGAIIGGVIGAGAGAATGILLDKNKKKKEAKAKDTASTGTTTKEPDSK